MIALIVAQLVVYPWCGINNTTGSRGCYYRTWEECRATLRGIGGLCVMNPQVTYGKVNVEEAQEPAEEILRPAG